MEYDIENMDVRSRMNDVAHAIQAMPAVSRLSQTHNGHMFSRKPTGFKANLKCYSSRQDGGCGKQQEPSVLLSQKRLTLLACLEELRNRIEQKHGVKCATAAEAWESAQTPKAVSTPAQQDIFKAMMEIEAAKKRAVIANKASLEAEQEKDAAEKELEILKSRLGQKRARLPDAAEEEDDDGEESVSDWDLAAHRREATRVQNRRAIELGSRENVKELRRGEVDYLAHP